jgi:hypothetical protein
VERYARAALRSLLRDYAKAGHRVRRAAIVVSSLTDPASIANQHMRAHASEGQLYRRVAEQGLARCGVKTQVILERETYTLLAKALRRGPAAAKNAVAALSEEALGTEGRGGGRVAAGSRTPAGAGGTRVTYDE